MAVRPIDGEALLRELTCDFTGTPFHGNKKVTIGEVRRIIESMPTLTLLNEPLPVLVNDETGREYIDYICPRCKDIISQRRRGQRMETVYQCKFHDNCGQRVDWENQQSYRRPPEGEEGDANRG